MAEHMLGMYKIVGSIPVNSNQMFLGDVKDGTKDPEELLINNTA